MLLLLGLSSFKLFKPFPLMAPEEDCKPLGSVGVTWFCLENSYTFYSLFLYPVLLI